MYYFTADEHYNHSNIIRYCNRPFQDVAEMDEEIIRRHNEVVGEKDRVVHLGDLTLLPPSIARDYIKRLNGQHTFLQGSHDRWKEGLGFIWEKKIEDIYVVACHYPMRSWPRSFHGSWHLHGHVHGLYEKKGTAYQNTLDVGVDAWNFYPVSWEEICQKLGKEDEEGSSPY